MKSEERILPRTEEIPEPLPGPHLKAITQAIREIRFGTIEIVVQDGKVIQINKTEKIRF